MTMIVEAALEKLKEGNTRFVKGQMQHPNQKPEYVKELVKGQRPFVCILTCSDSRVVPELIFDAGVGDVFCIRNAGNITDPHVLGSIQYAVEYLDVPVVLVLGHTHCGAIAAAISKKKVEGMLCSVLDSLEPVICATPKGDEHYHDCVVNNAKRGVEDIMNSIPSCKERIRSKKLAVQAAIYRIEDGVVDFL